MLGAISTATTCNNNNNSHSQPNNMLLLISSSTSSSHQFPQNHQLIDEKQSSLMMASSTSPAIQMEKSNQHQQNSQQQSLKCPRCDSSNTKFCYYNNYSLSQPRHFCKACKRYWTRGGTLRNVPVGGGCRKNKRIKKPSSSISAVDNSPNSSSTPSSNPNHLQSSSSNPIINPPLFYGIPTSTDPTHLNLPYPNFNSRVSVSGYEGLGFSSGLTHYPNYPNGFNPKEIQEVNSNSLLSRYPIFGSYNLHEQQQKFMGLLPYEDMQMMGSNSNSDGNMVTKEVKMEGSQNKFNWDSATQMDQIGSSDPSILWSTPGVGSWLDPSNIGSSVPSLI